MTVGELKDELRDYDDDTRVIHRGYEGGYSDIGEVEEVDIVLDVNDKWYYGPHDRPNSITVPENKDADETALLL